MSRQEEKLILPEPLKVKPSIAKYLDKLEEDGKTIWAFGGTDIIENIFYSTAADQIVYWQFKKNKSNSWWVN